MGVRRFNALAAAIEKYFHGRSVLEIGPGDGELARILIDAGYEYVGVDRKPRIELPQILAVDFMDFESTARFDCVVTQYVLHHVPDIAAFVNRMLRFCKPDGIIAIGEYGWERSDDPVFRSERSDLHTSDVMIETLDFMLERLFYEDVPYKDGHDSMGFVWVGRRAV